MLIAMFASTLTFEVVRATPKTWIVDAGGQGDFTTIQAAVDAASPFDTIFVRSGHYNENVTVNTNYLDIIGQDRNTTVLNGNFRVFAWYCVVANFSLVNPSGAEIYGFEFDQASFNVIRSNLINGFTGGMRFNYMNNSGSQPVLEPATCHNNVVTDNTIWNCTWEDIFFMVGFTNNSFYHNNFFMPRLSDVTIDYAESFNEFWDAGYPCGGNYWADYNGTDTQSGPYQNLTGSDGIGDTNYTIPGVEFPVVVDVDHYPLMRPWIGTVDDVAVLNVTPRKTVVGVGEVVSVDVFIANTGDFQESLNPACRANGTAVNRLRVLPVSLNSDCFVNYTFAWNTSTFVIGKYWLNGSVAVVPGETHTSDNALVQGSVTVSIQGDLNGDFTVDIYDAIRLAGAYNSNVGSPNWNPNADINNDGVVDIYDAILLAGHFNQHYP